MPDEDARVALAAQSGLRIDHLRLLTRRLEEDFRIDHWGYAQLADVGDVRRRAILSDYILASAESVVTNLQEARTAELDYGALTAEGIRYADGVRLDDTRQDMLIASFFRAFGSTLDCLAGTAIGVLRVPRAIVRASMRRDLFALDAASATTADARAAWGAFRALLDALRKGPPDSWMDWALLYRNALLHRPRQINMMLPRVPATSLILPPWRAHELLRYDLYLRRRPWLPELEHLATHDRPVEDLFLREPAAQTLRGLMELLNEASERIAEHIRGVWERVAAGELGLASPPWQLEAEPDIEFAGFAPSDAATGDIIRGHTQTATRIALAERVRLLALEENT